MPSRGLTKLGKTWALAKVKVRPLLRQSKLRLRHGRQDSRPVSQLGAKGPEQERVKHMPPGTEAGSGLPLGIGAAHTCH